MSDTAIVVLLRAGNLVRAIKAHREATGASIPDARRHIQALIPTAFPGWEVTHHGNEVVAEHKTGARFTLTRFPSALQLQTLLTSHKSEKTPR